jgi:hypothetical protein
MATKLTLKEYLIVFHLTQGELDWTDDLPFNAYSVEELIKQVKSYIAGFYIDCPGEDNCITVLCAEVLDDDLDADARDIIEQFPEDMLA